MPHNLESNENIYLLFNIIIIIIVFQYRNNSYKDDNCKDDGVRISVLKVCKLESQQPQKKTNI